MDKRDKRQTITDWFDWLRVAYQSSCDLVCNSNLFHSFKDYCKTLRWIIAAAAIGGITWVLDFLNIVLGVDVGGPEVMFIGRTAFVIILVIGPFVAFHRLRMKYAKEEEDEGLRTALTNALSQSFWTISQLIKQTPQTSSELEAFRGTSTQAIELIFKMLEAVSPGEGARFYAIGSIPKATYLHAMNEEHSNIIAHLDAYLKNLEKAMDRIGAKKLPD